MADSALDTLLLGFERAVTVEMIATSPFLSCTPDDTVDTALTREGFKAFDHIPVTSVSGDVVGMLLRDDGPDRDDVVEAAMRPFDAKMLISADAPIEHLFRRFSNQCQYLLVVDRHGVSGLVTESDLSKLPVRVYAYALLAELEMLINVMIRRTSSTLTDWADILTKDKYDKLEAAWERDKAGGKEIDVTESADLSHKIEFVRKNRLTKVISSKSMGSLVDVRHMVAHQREYAGSWPDSRTFIERMVLTRDIVAKLGGEVGPRP